MKLSHGLKLILSPLQNLGIVSVHNLFEAMRKAGKRGQNSTLYPTDFRKVNIILETYHEISGNTFSVEVEGENMQHAINTLSTWIKEEDLYINRIAA